MSVLTRLAWKFFPPYEVTATCEQIRHFLALRTALNPPELERLAIALAKDSERTVYSIRFDRKTPEHLALILISNVLSQLLPSGRYHLYRGVLTGQGAALLQTWHEVIAELQESGYYTKEEADQDVIWMKRELLVAG